MQPNNFSRSTDEELNSLVAHFYHELKPINHAKKRKTEAIVSIASALLINILFWFWVLKSAGWL